MKRQPPTLTHPVVRSFVGMHADYRLATLLCDVKGRGGFTRWKEGEIVKVHRVKGVRWLTIEKLKPKRIGKGCCRWAPPILNTCCNIPRKWLRFHH